MNQEELKNEFKSYCMAKGYDIVRGTIAVSPTLGCRAIILGHNVNLKDFTEITRSGHGTIVRLGVDDYNNEEITQNLFRINN